MTALPLLACWLMASRASAHVYRANIGTGTIGRANAGGGPHLRCALTTARVTCKVTLVPAGKTKLRWRILHHGQVYERGVVKARHGVATIRVAPLPHGVYELRIAGLPLRMGIDAW